MPDIVSKHNNTFSHSRKPLKLLFLTLVLHQYSWLKAHIDFCKLKQVVKISVLNRDSIMLCELSGTTDSCEDMWAYMLVLVL